MFIGKFEIVQTEFANFQVRRNHMILKESSNLGSCVNFVLRANDVEQAMMDAHRAAFDAQRERFYNAN